MSDRYIELTEQLSEWSQSDNIKDQQIDDPEAQAEDLDIGISEKLSTTPTDQRLYSCSRLNTSSTCIRAPPFSK